jgi:hypothetical protein
MNTAVWIVSGLLAATYLFAGFNKVTQPLSKLRPQMGWVDEIPERLVRVIGILEILGAAGLILPKLTGVIDERSGVEGTLTGLAATGLVAIQVLAIPVHLRRGEPRLITVNLVLGALAAYVAIARFGWF